MDAIALSDNGPSAVGEYLDIASDQSSFSFSTLQDVSKIAVTVDSSPVPYFEATKPVPAHELPTIQEPSMDVDGVRLRAANFTQLKSPRLRVAAIAADSLLPFWNGERLYHYAGVWSVMRPSDWHALERAPVHARAKIEVVQSELKPGEADLLLPDAGAGELVWRHAVDLEGVRYLIGLEHAGLVFARYALLLTETRVSIE